MLLRKTFRRFSLRVAMTVVFGSLLTVMAGLTWFLTFRSGQASILELADQIGHQSMFSIRRNLQDYVAAPQLANEINVSSIAEEGVAALAPAGLIRRLMAELNRFPSAVSIAYASEQGDYIGVARGVSNVPLSLAISNSSTGHFLEAYSLDGRGRRLGRFDRSAAPYDPRVRPWYTTAVKSGAPAWTPVYLWLSGDAGLDLVTPVRDSEGMLLGVLDTSLTLSEIAKFLQTLKATENSEAFILERSGLLVATTGNENPHRRMGDPTRRLAATESQNEIVRASASEIVRALASADGINGERQFMLATSQGRVDLRVSPFRDALGLDWLVAQAIPESDFAQKIYRGMQTTAALVALFLMISIGIVLLLARWIVSPLRTLSQQARGFAKGELGQAIQIEGADEVGQLAASFNLLGEELRRSFGSLTESEARYRTLFESMPVGLFRADEAGGIEQANPRLRAMFGFSGSESLSGVTASSLLSDPKDWLRLRALLEKEAALQDVEVQMLRRDGAAFEARVHVHLRRDPSDGRLHYEGSIVDVTERRRLEDQLRQSQKMEAIGHLAGGVAHDFNNILAATMMNLDMLQQNKALDAETREALNELREGAERAAGLTRELLMFGRRSVLEKRAVDLGEVAENLLKMLGRILGDDISLSFQREKGLPLVEADVGMLEQVLLNLAVNSRDAMTQGGRIILATEVMDIDAEAAQGSPNRREGRFVRLSVSDTGCGMDGATMQRAFEPFFTTKPAGKGTGLGLATVYGIVAQHSGWVEVESRVGEGTTFRIYLPVTAKAAAEREEKGKQAVSGGRETILAVEDEVMVRLLLAKALRKLGYRVLEAANGSEAMAVWGEHGGMIDLLISDMVMPEGMTGLELAEKVRAEKPGLKVIISSGYNPEMNEAGAPKAEGIIYLTKPYRMAALGTIVRQCLDER